MAGAMLPEGDDVLLRGMDWDTWLSAQPVS
jgi:hypothetical protein